MSVLVPGLAFFLVSGCAEEDEPAIAAPSGLQFSATTVSSISMFWTDNSHNEDGFRIYRSTDGSNYSVVDTSLFTSFQDNTVSEDILYYYYVTAYNATDESGRSNTISVLAKDPYVKVLTLNSPTTLTIDDMYDITWETNYPSFDARILLSLDGGTTLHHIIQPAWGDNGSSFPWKVGYKDTSSDPLNPQWVQVVSSTETQCIVLVRDYDDASLFDENDAEFTIQP